MAGRSGTGALPTKTVLPRRRAAPGHARKFMQLDGEWIDQDDEIGCSSMWAWGEWEAQSDLIRELDQMGDPAFPRYLWEPFYARRPHGYRGLHNTDPFIFGDRFPVLELPSAMEAQAARPSNEDR